MATRIRIITALTLMAIAGYPACQRTREVRPSSGDADHIAGREPQLVQDYLQVADAVVADNAALDEKVLADALRHLAAALGTLGLADVELQAALRVAAEHVLSSPQSVDTTAAVRKSLISAAQVIEADGSGGALLQSAESLRPDRPLQDQVPTVRDFFRQSGPALRRAAALVKDAAIRRSFARRRRDCRRDGGFEIVGIELFQLSAQSERQRRDRLLKGVSAIAS